MSRYDNYPPGAANDPNAPWNQESPYEYEVVATVGVYDDDCEIIEEVEVPVYVKLRSPYEYAEYWECSEAVDDAVAALPEWKGRHDYDIFEFDFNVLHSRFRQLAKENGYR